METLIRISFGVRAGNRFLSSEQLRALCSLSSPPALSPTPTHSSRYPRASKAQDALPAGFPQDREQALLLCSQAVRLSNNKGS